MQGRFNLNNLLIDDGKVNESARSSASSGCSSNAGADRRWARIAADWLDSDTVRRISRRRGGRQLPVAESALPRGQWPGDDDHRADGAARHDTRGVPAHPALRGRIAARARRSISARRLRRCSRRWSRAARISAMPTRLRPIAGHGCFPTIEDMQGDVGRGAIPGARGTISESSNWFRAVTAVSIGTSELTLYSLIERNNTGGSRTVLRSTGTE